MKCGIVILNYNAYDFTCNIVKQVLSIDLIDKIVLIDDNSDDDFKSFVKKINSKKIKYIKNEKVLEYAKGYNIGLKYLKGIGCEYAFVSKPNVNFTYETIKKILNFLEKNQRCGVASCIRTENEKINNSMQFWSLPTFTETLLESIALGRKYQKSFNKIITNQYLKNNKQNESISVEVVNGAFIGCNLKILEKVGYFDEIPVMFYEENNLSYKLKVKGYKVAYLKTCSYEHQLSSLPKSPNLFNLFLDSKRYYCEIYLNIGIIKAILLLIFEFMGRTEIELLALFSKKKKTVPSRKNKGEKTDDRKKAKSL